jgi:rSAM/selenodomain-associated transferase 1
MPIAEPDRAAPSSCGIAVMAKASAPGRAKTRLVPPLTADEAAAFNTAFLQDVAANIRAAGKHTDIAGYMAFGPPGPESVAFFRRVLPPDIGLLEAWYPYFGDCLFSAIEQLLARGHAGAVLLNSDSPTMPTSFLIETARLLAGPGDCAVLGPATDGGYNLLGVKHAHRRLFEDIAWSTEHVARQTLERAAEIGLRVHVLPAWYDVDDVASLKTLHSELCDETMVSATLQSHHAPHTARLMRALLADTDLAGRLAAAAGADAQRAAE